MNTNSVYLEKSLNSLQHMQTKIKRKRLERKANTMVNFDDTPVNHSTSEKGFLFSFLCTCINITDMEGAI